MQAIGEHLDVIVRAMGTTASLAAISFALALVLGVAVASCRIGPVPPLRWGAVVWVELLRNTPLTVLMFMWFFGLPKVGVLFSSYLTAVIALSLYTSAFVAETVRSGVNTVGQGQLDACRALGLGVRQTLTSVVMPQALRTVVSPLGGVLSALIRNTSVAYTISVAELSREVDRLANETAQTTPLLIGAGVAYLLMTVPTGVAAGALQRRLAIRR